MPQFSASPLHKRADYLSEVAFPGKQTLRFLRRRRLTGGAPGILPGGTGRNKMRQREGLTPDVPLIPRGGGGLNGFLETVLN